MTDAVLIVPDMVWGMVLDKLGAREVYSCTQVCVTFQMLLKKKRVTALFPLVFRLVVNQNVKFADVLSSRAVCRSWKHTVDKYWGTLDFQLDHRKGSRKDLRFESLVDIQQFLVRHESRPDHFNPFILTQIFFQDTDSAFYQPPNENEELSRRFWDAAAALLEKFGKHVWYCNVAVEMPTLTHGYLYENILHRMTSLMPALRTLCVTIRSRPFYNVTKYEWQRSVSNVRPLLEQFPLPKLPHLFRLSLCGFPRVLGHELLKSAHPSNLRRLIISDFQGNDRAGCDSLEIVSKFTHLERLGFSSLYNSAALQELQHATWPLKNLHLQVRLSSVPTERTITISKLFDTVNRFGETLLKLSLGMTGETQYDGSGEHAELRLRLPVLKDLVVSSRTRVVVNSLDFAVELKELTDFVLFCGTGFTEREAEGATARVIQVSNKPEELQNSNLWKVLPKLESFTLNAVLSNRWLNFHKEVDGNVSVE